VSAALEVQSTSGAFLLPRMTTAQINALPTPTNGMSVYDTTVNGMRNYTNGAWANTLASNFIRIELSSANIIGMFGAPIQVLPAPGVGFAYLVDVYTFNLIAGGTAYTGGGTVSLQYGITGGLAAPLASGLQATVVRSAASSLSYGSGNAGNAGNVITNYNNGVVSISNQAAAFATGNGTAILTVYYSIIPVS
jgi:hypothetical protein